MYRCVRRWLCFLGLYALAVSIDLQAQPPGSPAESLAITAEEKLQSGDAKRAAELYEELLKKYPTFEGTSAAQYNLGFAYYILDEYDKAVTLFKKLVEDKNGDKDLREQALLLMANVRTGQAQSLPKEREADRAKGLTEAIQLFDDYLKKYPEGKNRADAPMARQPRNTRRITSSMLNSLCSNFLPKRVNPPCAQMPPILLHVSMLPWH